MNASGEKDFLRVNARKCKDSANGILSVSCAHR